MVMQPLWQIIYSWLVYPAIWLIVHLLAFNKQNLKDGLAGRKGLWQRLEMQLCQRDPQKPLIWFHVASAGEFLQAQPVIERCLRQGIQCALTFMSVNGYKWIQRQKFPEDQRPVVMDYLPLDSVGNMRKMLRILQPAAIVYVQYDLWPNLIWEAHKLAIPQYLISAMIQPHSKRWISALGRSFYRTLYACLNGIFTISDADRQRFLATNSDHPNIQTVGNTRFDSVLDRKKKLAPLKLPAYLEGKFVFIAGSSWPSDEACIFPVLHDALSRYPQLVLIIVPHEPTEAHLRNSETYFQEVLPVRFTCLQYAPEQVPRMIIGDTVGILSALYAAGTAAYVGGAFTTGVHNVMEPAVMGLPVIFGPKHQNSPEAVDLVKRGLAFTVTTTDEFRTVFFRLLTDPQSCKHLGEQAAQVIEAQAGAADRCFDAITQVLHS